MNPITYHTKEMNDPFVVGQTELTITIKHRKTDEGMEYRWWRSDGQWVSPIYTTAEAAQWCHSPANPKRLPFLSDDEWREFHPFPHPVGKTLKAIIAPTS